MNSLTQRLKNTGYITVSEAAKPALSFILVLFISRSLGREGIGSYTLILTFTGLFELVATLGLGPLIVRTIAADRSNVSWYLNGAAGVALLATCCVTPVMLLILRALHYPPQIALGIRLLSWTLLLSILQQYVTAAYEGLQNISFRSLLSLLDTAGRLVTGIFMVVEGHGVLGIIEGMLVIRAIVTVVAVLTLVRHCAFSFNLELMLRSFAPLAKRGLPFLLAAISSAVFWSVNTLMLSKLSTIADVGLYNSAFRITDIVKNIVGSYLIILLPLMSAAFVKSLEDLASECNNSLKFITLVTVPAAVGIALLAHRIIRLVYGHNFDPAVPILRVLAFTVCAFCIAVVFARVLIASHHQLSDLCCNVAALIINVALGWPLIRSFHSLGAALGTLASLIAFGIFEYRIVAHRLFRPKIAAPLVRAVGASLPMALVLYLLNVLPLPLLIVLGFLSYLGGLLCLRTFSREEIEAVLGCLRGRTSELPPWAERITCLPQAPSKR